MESEWIERGEERKGEKRVRRRERVHSTYVVVVGKGRAWL